MFKVCLRFAQIVAQLLLSTTRRGPIFGRFNLRKEISKGVITRQQTKIKIMNEK